VYKYSRVCIIVLDQYFILTSLTAIIIFIIAVLLFQDALFYSALLFALLE